MRGAGRAASAVRYGDAADHYHSHRAVHRAWRARRAAGPARGVPIMGRRGRMVRNRATKSIWNTVCKPPACSLSHTIYTRSRVRVASPCSEANPEYMRNNCATSCAGSKKYKSQMKRECEGYAQQGECGRMRNRDSSPFVLPTCSRE